MRFFIAFSLLFHCFFIDVRLKNDEIPLKNDLFSTNRIIDGDGGGSVSGKEFYDGMAVSVV